MEEQRNLDNYAINPLSPLAEELTELNNFFNLSYDLFCVLDDRLIFKRTNPSFTRLLGYSVDELKSKTLFDLVHSDDISITDNFLNHPENQNLVGRLENRCKKNDGEFVWLSWSFAIDERGKIYGVAKDITWRKKASLIIEQNEKRFHSLVKNSYDMVAIIDQEGNFRYHSDSSLRVLGYMPEELIGKNALDMIHPEDKERVGKNLKRLTIKGFENNVPPFRLKTKKGEWIWVEVTGTNLMNDPSINGLVINSRDITERVKLEKKLAKQQAEHQQQITAAVIMAQERERSLLGLELHDNVNQVLTTTKLYLEMFLSNMTNDRNILNKAAQYIQNCIDEIRSISKRLSAPTLGNISIKDSLKELVSTINLSNKINIQLIVADLEDYKINQELHIAIYRIVQEQLNNILKHAEASKAWIILTKRNRGLRLLIKDNGKGFDKGAKKEGIGFTNIAFRVEALKGKMSINSELGMGCKIDVFLPLKGEQ